MSLDSSRKVTLISKKVLQIDFYWQESDSGCCVHVSKYHGSKTLKMKSYCLSPKNDSSVAAFNTKYWSRENGEVEQRKSHNY